MKALTLIFLVIFMSSCTAVNSSTKTAENSSIQANSSDQPKPAPQPSTLKPAGTIFGKINFAGKIDASYVQLVIVSLANPNNIYQLYVGDRTQNNFSWKEQALNTEYFFMELPPGF